MKLTSHYTTIVEDQRLADSLLDLSHVASDDTELFELYEQFFAALRHHFHPGEALRFIMNHLEDE